MQEEKSEKAGFFRFLISKSFFINAGIAVIIMIIMFFGLVKFLDYYTNHGEEYKLPDFYGMTISEIDSAGFTEFYDFFVIDSLHDKTGRKGSVVIQNPIPGSKVKKGRNVYFTVVAILEEMVIMPDLKDLTLRQAVNILESKSLKTGKLIYQPSFDKNAVLEQFYNRDTIFPGDTLETGSTIDLVVGSGDKNYKIPVPFLIGLTREEAIYALNTASFNLGNEFYMDTVIDEHSRVFMQEPMEDSEISFFPGDSVHLWYRSDTAFNFEEYMIQFLPDSLQPDSLSVDTIFNEF